MKHLNNINFIESLARGTRHYDQEIIKRSLLEALKDFSFNAEYELYRVYSTPLETTLSLLALDKDNNIETFKNGRKCDSFPVYLFSGISNAIESNSVNIISAPDDTGNIHYIYPASDKKRNIFTVLIQTTQHEIKQENQRLVHGLLKLYSNYLHLLEKIKRDNLTNLLNRETLDTEITQILEKTSNNQLIFSNKPQAFTEQREKYEDYKYWLGVLDIDFFKKINDSYGHLYGDEVLIMVARLIEKNVRNFDLVFRYGGEEFVIILKSHDIKIARLAFERIRKQIEAHAFGKIEQLTVSIGIDQIIHQSGTAEIIGCADKALYFAKDNGRNQSCFYEELPDQKDITAESEENNIEFL